MSSMNPMDIERHLETFSRERLKCCKRALPQVIGIISDTVEAMNRTAPNQSNLLNLATSLPGTRSNVRKKKIATTPGMIKTKFIQKIHLQETFWAKAPPTMEMIG